MSGTSISAYGIWFVGMLVILATVILSSLGLIDFTDGVFLFSCVWGIGGYLLVILIGYFGPNQYHWR